MPAYNLLAIDPGSEKSAFLWCRVTPPEEKWMSHTPPFGLAPHPWPGGGDDSSPLEMKNESALEWIRQWICATPRPVLAVEYIPGIYAAPRPSGQGPRVFGRDQIEAMYWAGVFACPFIYRKIRVEKVTRSTAASTLGAKGDSAVRQALVDIYGGKAKAVGGGRCKICKKAEGWIGRDHEDCPSCKGGHGDTGFENPRGVLYGWKGSHGFAALAVAIVAAQRIGRG